MADSQECKNFLTVKDELNEATEENTQQSRAFLRERFLRALFAVSNKPCTLRLYENTVVNATFRCTDIDMTVFQVSNLATPLGVLPEAFIRSTDVLTISVPTSCEDQIGTVY